MTTDLIDELADQVETLIDSGEIFSLRIEPGDTPEHRPHHRHARRGTQ